MNQKLSIPYNNAPSPIIGMYRGVLEFANAIPLSIVQLVSRAAVASVFWKSAQVKLASWQATEQLFALEYKIPLLPPSVAATLATTVELCAAGLIFFGLFARFSALALLGVVAVIQLFVYPQNWGDHLLWTGLLLLILARGAGTVSIDHVVRRYFDVNG